MSVDIKIQNNCDHTINWERLPLQVDGRAFSPTYPLGSTVSLSVRINNVNISPDSYTTALNSDLTLSPTSAIKLKTVCRLYYPIIEVQYITLKTYCPKCLGLSTLDDFLYAPNKDVLTVKDEFLLMQTFEKLIITKLNSNKYYSWIGTTLHTLIGKKIIDIDYFKTKISEDIKKCVEDLKRLEAQYVSTGRTISKGELFGELLGVDVTVSDADPTLIKVLVKYTAQSGRAVEYQQLLQLSQLRKR